MKLFYGLAFFIAVSQSVVFAAGPLPPLPSPLYATHSDECVTADMMHHLVEEAWLQATRPVITTQADAAGACNGVKDGTYGFHVGAQAHPWWQVDLGSVQQVGAVVVYNRLDYAPGLHNADTLHILSSPDGEEWTLRHDNQGRHFGGIHGEPPLRVTFEDGIPARFIRIAIPSDIPVFLHLDEVEVYGVDDDETNIALHQPADQSSLSPWSVPKIETPRVYATEAFIDRGRRLALYLQEQGVDVSQDLTALEAVAERYAALPEDATDEAMREVYFDVRWVVRRIVFKNPLLDFDELLFVKRFTQETFPDICLNHMPWVSRPGGDLCVLRPVDAEKGLFAALKNPAPAENDPAVAVRNLLNGALGPGNVHGMDLWFGGDRIVFGYARARSDEPPEGWLDRTQSFRLRREVQPTHLFELCLNTGLVRQITEGEWSDLDPAYAPNGDIVFVSERCGTSLQCNEYDKDETSCNLYVVQPDGSGVRRLSVNKDGDYMPNTLDNGLIAYTRWEYQERGFAFIHSIWTVRPDGTGADALFAQHMENPWAVVDARSIPGSDRLIALASGHHTLAVGSLILIDPSMGVNNPDGISIVSPLLGSPQGGMAGNPVPEGGTDDSQGFYTTPWALSDKFFLASYAYGNEMTDPTGYGLYLVDVYGNKELIYRDPEISCFMPVPLRPRPMPHILPPAMDPDATYARCYITDIAYGVEGISTEEARYLRVAEPVPWPYDNTYGGHRYGEDHRYGGPDADRRNLTNWTPVRILGDVPVNPDGSAFFKVPADTAVYFQLLDENRMELRRMRSFISFQPGEARGCVGCHETGEVAALQPSPSVFAAFAEAPSEKLMAPWGDRPINFLRDVQPILDAHCVECHTGLSPAGGLDFAGGLIAWDPEVPHYGHNRAFETILKHHLAAMSPAREHDAGVTPPRAYGAINSELMRVLDDDNHPGNVSLSDEERLRFAMWIDANAPYHDRFVNKRSGEPVYCIAADTELQGNIRQVHERSCVACHDADDITRPEWINLHRPDESLFLAAPLSSAAGGLERCEQVTYSGTDDPDYVLLRGLVDEAVKRAWTYPRRDVASLNRLAWLFAQNNPGRLSEQTAR